MAKVFSGFGVIIVISDTGIDFCSEYIAFIVSKLEEYILEDIYYLDYMKKLSLYGLINDLFGNYMNKNEANIITLNTLILNKSFEIAILLLALKYLI